MLTLTVFKTWALPPGGPQSRARSEARVDLLPILGTVTLTGQTRDTFVLVRTLGTSSQGEVRDPSLIMSSVPLKPHWSCLCPSSDSVPVSTQGLLPHPHPSLFKPHVDAVWVGPLEKALGHVFKIFINSEVFLPGRITPEQPALRQGQGTREGSTPSGCSAGPVPATLSALSPPPRGSSFHVRLLPWLELCPVASSCPSPQQRATVTGRARAREGRNKARERGKGGKLKQDEEREGTEYGLESEARGQRRAALWRSRQEVVTFHHGPSSQCWLKIELFPRRLRSPSPRGRVQCGPVTLGLEPFLLQACPVLTPLTARPLTTHPSAPHALFPKVFSKLFPD